MTARFAPARDIAPFAVRGVPEAFFGPGRVREIATDAAAVGDPEKAVVMVADAALVHLGIAHDLVQALQRAGAKVKMFSDVAGEPKQRQVEAATAFVRAADAGLVVCLGGGSATDVGKVAATVAVTDGAPSDFPRSASRRPQAPARNSPRPTFSPTARAGRSGSGAPRPSPTG